MALLEQLTAELERNRELLIEAEEAEAKIAISLLTKMIGGAEKAIENQDTVAMSKSLKLLKGNSK